jgi:hypothetical protein
MRTQVVFCSFISLIAAFSAVNVASASTQTISASARNGGQTPGTAAISSPSAVTCTAAMGGTSGTKCRIIAPGYSGLVSVGQSIGTTGAGTVTLYCSGSYPANGGLSCTAKVDDTMCTPEQTIIASSSGGGSTIGLAPIKSPAIVECIQATGGQNGTRCAVQSPGFNGYLTAGQSIGTSGAGTVFLGCSGSYPANGGLSCAAQVSQVCP